MILNDWGLKIVFGYVIKNLVRADMESAPYVFLICRGKAIFAQLISFIFAKVIRSDGSGIRPAIDLCHPIT